MNKKLFILICSNFFAITSNVYAYNKEQNKAPEIEVKSMNTSEILKIDNFKGKFIILDFWATWCEPCLKAMSHLSEIQKKYNDKIKVISISDESEDVIKKFLEKNKFGFSIVHDINKRTNKLYPHNSLPFIVVITPTKEILGTYFPEQLSMKNIDKIVSGNTKEIENNYLTSNNDIFNDKELISYSYLSKGAKNSYSDMSFEVEQKTHTPYELSILNMNLLSIYKNLYFKFSDNQIINEIKNKEYSNDKLYSFKVRVSKKEVENDFESFFSTTAKYLDLNSGLHSQIIKKKIKVKIMKLKEQNSLIKNNSKTNNIKSFISLLKKSYKGENIPMNFLVKELNTISEIYIKNETNFTDKFNIDFEWRFNDFESLEIALKNKGIYFDDAELEIEHLVISG